MTEKELVIQLLKKSKRTPNQGWQLTGTVKLRTNRKLRRQGVTIAEKGAVLTPTNLSGQCVYLKEIDAWWRLNDNFELVEE